jgi:beta-lactamase regulating signal transducer with metallopeptidase domain
MSVFTSASSAGIVIAKSSLLLALGWGVTRLLHRARAPMRHAVWLTTIVGVLAIPVLDHFSPVALRVLPAEAPLSIYLPSTNSNTESRFSTPQAIQRTVFPRAIEQPTVRPTAWPSIGGTILMVWAGVAALMLFRLILGAFTVARIVRRGRTIDANEWITALSNAAQRMYVRVLPRLVMSDEVDMAFAFASTAPVIVLPAQAQEWSNECRHSVLSHELAHLRRRDVIGQLIAAATLAVHWFNPLMWIAVRRLRLESELACDDIVLGTGVHASVYAQHLLDMVMSFGRRTPAVAMTIASPQDFERRLVAILDSADERPIGTRRLGPIAAGIIGLSAISIGAAAPVQGRVRADHVAGIAFGSGGNHVALAVESAARRGRVDILAVDSAAPVLLNGLNLAPLGVQGDYYLFDSTSFVLVRPASKTFTIFAVVDATYNFNGLREDWPQAFDFPTIRTQPVSVAQSAIRQLERHGAFHIYWGVDVDSKLPSFTVLTRGRMSVGDAPLGESTVAKWFGPALALAKLATIDSTWFPNERIGLAAVAPLVGDDASTTNFMSRQRLTRLRIAPIDLTQLTLPSDYTAVSVAGSLPESRARELIAGWRTPPRAR